MPGFSDLKRNSDPTGSYVRVGASGFGGREIPWRKSRRGRPVVAAAAEGFGGGGDGGPRGEVKRAHDAMLSLRSHWLGSPAGRSSLPASPVAARGGVCGALGAGSAPASPCRRKMPAVPPLTDLPSAASSPAATSPAFAKKGLLALSLENSIKLLEDRDVAAAPFTENEQAAAGRLLDLLKGKVPMRPPLPSAARPRERAGDPARRQSVVSSEVSELSPKTSPRENSNELEYHRESSQSSMQSHDFGRPAEVLMQNGPGLAQDADNSPSASPRSSPISSPRKRKQAAITTAMICKRLLFTGQLRSKAIHDMLLALIIELASIPSDSVEFKYQYIRSRTAQLVGAEQCSMWVVDEDSQDTLIELGGEEDVHESCDRRQSALAVVYRTGGHVLYRRDDGEKTDSEISDIEGENGPEASKKKRRLEEEDDASVRSVLAVPILRDAKVTGALRLVNKRKGTGFGEGDTQLLEAVSMITSLLLRCGVLDHIARRQEVRAKELLKLASLIASADFERDNLIATVMESARELTRSEGCSLFILSENGRLTPHGDAIKGPSSMGIAMHVLRQNAPLKVDDVDTHPLFRSGVFKKHNTGTKSLLCLPVTCENSIVAIAQLTNKKRGASVVRYSQEDVELFGYFSVFVGVSIRNLKQHKRLQTVLSRNQAIMASVRRLAVTDMRDVEDVVHNVIQGAKDVVAAQKCALFLVDKEKNELFAIYERTDDDAPDGSSSGRASDEEREGDHASLRFPAGKGIVGSVAATGEVANIPDVKRDARYDPEIDETAGVHASSMLCLPVLHNGQIVAVLQLVNKVEQTRRSSVTSPGNSPVSLQALLPFAQPSPDTSQPNAAPPPPNVFTKEDVDLFVDFSEFVGVSLYNNKIYQFAVSARDNAMLLLKMQDKPSAGAAAKVRLCSEADISVYQSLRLTAAECEVGVTPAFNIHALHAAAPDKVVLLLVELFRALGSIDDLSIDEGTLLRFLAVVRLNYRQVHYHNFFHAADVCHTIFCYLQFNGLKARFTPVESFALMVTSLVHDVDHMGLNNSFHFKTETPMGILSNSTGSSSILEVHHCNTAIDILGNTACDVFSSLSDPDKKQAYKIMINGILATDMARHVELHAAFNKITDLTEYSSDEAKGVAMQMLLKSADISNITKPFDISKCWAVAVTEEFYCQGDKERELGEAVSPMYDREQEVALAKGQIDFIKNVGVAHFSSVVRLFPEMTPWLTSMNDNLERWERQLREATAISSSPMPRK
eukprot:gene19346-29793_t